MTDDTAALQDMIDAGAVVPPGVFRFRRLTLRDGDALVGSGPCATVLHLVDDADPTEVVGVTAEPGAAVTVRGVQLDGNQSSYLGRELPARGQIHHHGINFGAKAGVPARAEIHGVDSHDWLRNGFLLGAPVTRCSRLRGGNSACDHVVYCGDGADVVIAGLDIAGHWTDPAIAAYGGVFASVRVTRIDASPWPDGTAGRNRVEPRNVLTDRPGEGGALMRDLSVALGGAPDGFALVRTFRADTRVDGISVTGPYPSGYEDATFHGGQGAYDVIGGPEVWL